MFLPLRLTKIQKIATIASLVAYGAMVAVLVVPLPGLPSPARLAALISYTLLPIIVLSKPVLWLSCRWQLRSRYSVPATIVWLIGAAGLYVSTPETLLVAVILAGIGYLLGIAGVAATRKPSSAVRVTTGSLGLLATAMILGVAAVGSQFSQIAWYLILAFVGIQETIGLLFVLAPLRHMGTTAALGTPVEVSAEASAIATKGEPAAPAASR